MAQSDQAKPAQAAQFGQWTDRKLEERIGKLLQVGVTLAAAVVLLGAMVYLIRHGRAAPAYHVFAGEPSDLRNISGIVHGALRLKGREIIQLGLLLLIATPVARVLFSLVAFAVQRDRLYVMVTLVVLAVLVYGLTGGRL